MQKDPAAFPFRRNADRAAVADVLDEIGLADAGKPAFGAEGKGDPAGQGFFGEDLSVGQPA